MQNKNLQPSKVIENILVGCWTQKVRMGLSGCLVLIFGLILGPEWPEIFIYNCKKRLQ